MRSVRSEISQDCKESNWYGGPQGECVQGMNTKEVCRSFILAIVQVTIFRRAIAESFNEQGC